MVIQVKTLSELSDLTGRVAVLTGGAGHIGHAMANALCELGAEVAVLVRAAEASFDNAKISYFQVDLEDEKARIDAAAKVMAHYERIDILINNAATWLPGSLTDTKDEDLLACVNSTVSGTMLTTKHFLPLLKKSDTPDVLTIVSQSGLTVRGGAVPNEAYRAAKSAQTAFMNGLRQAHPEMRVMSIFPPDFESDLEYKSPQWVGDFASGSARTMTARHVVNAILFALQQDRICTIETLALANSQVI